MRIGIIAASAAALSSLAAIGGTVSVPVDAEPSTLLARDEFTNYVCRITGRVDACPDTVIGTVKTLGAKVPAAAAEALEKTDDIEAAWTGFDGKTLWMVGKNEVAELYATYHFFESKLGVRWFQAKTKDDPGDWVPKMERIELKPFGEFREPAFKIRRLDQCHSFGNVPATNAAICAVRNGFQIAAPYGRHVRYDNPKSEVDRFYVPRVPRKLNSIAGGGDHMTFVSTFPPKTSFEKNPDVFAFVNGERRKGQQYCLASRKLRDATAERIIKALDAEHGEGRFLFGMQDTSWGWCECDACRALDCGDKPNDGTPVVSSRFVDAVNYISAKVWEKYPKADLRMWAYHTYRTFPTGPRPDPRLKLCFCDHGRCYGHELDDPKCSSNVKIYDMMKTWRDSMPYTYVYCYLFCTEVFYSCNEYGMADDIRKYAKMGIRGWKEEASFSDSKYIHPNAGGGYRPDSFPSVWQTLYVAGHMMWDTTLDERALLAEAEAKYYGAAYPAMKEYHDYRRKLWAEGRGCMGYPKGDQRRPLLLDAPGSKERLLSLLDRAESLAAGDSVRLFRIGRDRRWLQKYWIAPNEAFKAKMASAIYVPRTTKKVVLDGTGDEEAWNDAFTVPDGLLKKCGAGKKEMPEEIKTTIKVMCDKENIYFLMTALEPNIDKVKMHSRRGDIVWGDDGMEVFLYPPSIENVYYQLGMTPKGGMCAEKSGQKAPGEFDAELAGRMLPDRYVIELRVPVKNMYPLVDGEVWRVNLCRSRVFRSEFSHEEHYSIGGIGFRSTSEFHPFIIGSKKE